MAANPIKVILDTNILISAIGFGGKPRKVLHLILDDKIEAVTSPILMAELEDVVYKKFPKLAYNFSLIDPQIQDKFKIVKPKKSLLVARDNDDNRVLEAAFAGKCDYIITGDKDLLDLKNYKNIKIVTPDIFLSNILTD
ncbi:MAG: putative toxin-antitoxin system toxin component, PIN family [Candidatus Levybacteria bacterium]|nr:putative toxin-antitoxin system toxin component, PIN family [Candidatus Levybacteria bacterium]